MFRAAICAGRGCLVGDMCGVPPDGSLDVWTTPHGTKRGKRKMRTNLHLKTSFGRFDLLRYSRRLFFSRDTHLFISAAPNAFVFLILLVQIALVHCGSYFMDPRQENLWRLVCQVGGEGTSKFRGRSDEPQGYLAKG